MMRFMGGIVMMFGAIWSGVFINSLDLIDWVKSGMLFSCIVILIMGIVCTALGADDL